MTEVKQKENRGGKTLGVWGLAFLLACGVMVYQRLTGPTCPLRGQVMVGEVAVDYKLPRSGDSVRGKEKSLRLELPASGLKAAPVLHYRRYPTEDAFKAQEMVREEKGDLFVGGLPPQPAAGKLEYHIVFAGGARIPPDHAGEIILRCKDPVDSIILIPHIVLAVLTGLFGMRAALGALGGSPGFGRWAWLTLISMTGLVVVFGPLLQKQAFGSYWTGWPLGGDWTDNKSAIMWLAWVGGCLVLLKLRQRAPFFRRLVIILAALVMIGAYVIPHSLRGSELDYSRLKDGENPAKAVRTGH